MFKRRIRKRFRRKAALLLLCAALSAGLWAQSAGDALSEKVVRLHVTARSDSPEDQAVKLRVRDAVLARAEVELAEADTPARARELLRRILPALAETAAAVSGGPVRVSLGNEYFPSRASGLIALPAGRYTALRVTLGEGEGHNWWGVVYPPLFPAGDETVETSVLTEDDLKLITGDGEEYVFKFRVLEWWNVLTEKWREDE